EDKPTFTEPTIYRRERVADRTRDRGPTVRTQPARDATRAVFNRSNCTSRVPIPRSILAIAQRVLRARLYAVTSQAKMVAAAIRMRGPGAPRHDSRAPARDLSALETRCPRRERPLAHID